MGIFKRYDTKGTAFSPKGRVEQYEARDVTEWKTDLRYLRYESDRKNGGASNQPYAQFPVPGPYPKKLNRIPTVDVTPALTILDTVNSNSFLSGYQSNFNLRNTFIDLYNANSGEDFPIRGGGSFDTGVQTTTLAGQIDRQRISSFFYDLKSAKGKLFIEKQKKLQFSNPNMETGEGIVAPLMGSEKGIKGFLDAVYKQEFPAFQKNTRVYNEKNTLLQVAGSGTGLHAIRAGFSPFDLGQSFYQKTVGMQLFMDPTAATASNRLALLYQYKLANGAPIVSVTGNNGLNPSAASVGAINKLGISLNNLLLFDYPGGPNSAYGIGFTTIKRYTNTSPQPDKNRRVRTGLAMSYEQIAKQKINNTNTPGDPRVRDLQDFFLAAYNRRSGKSLTRENLYYGAADEDRIMENSFIAVEENVDPWTTKTSSDENIAYPDQIKFGFECISNDPGQQNAFLQFRAFLSNGLTDNHTGQWNSFKYTGRGESFYTYQGFERSISFGFRILVEHPKHLFSTYRKLNYLASQVYPDYSYTTNIMRAPIVKVTIGDYLYRVPGVLDNVSITVDQNTSWTSIGGMPESWYEDFATGDQNVEKYDQLAQMPQYVSVNVTFKPIISALPQRSTVSSQTSLIMNGQDMDADRTNIFAENDLNYTSEAQGMTRKELRQERREVNRSKRSTRRSDRAGRREDRQNDREANRERRLEERYARIDKRTVKRNLKKDPNYYKKFNTPFQPVIPPFEYSPNLESPLKGPTAELTKFTPNQNKFVLGDYEFKSIRDANVDNAILNENAGGDPIVYDYAEFDNQ